jgi:hypothetical protein
MEAASTSGKPGETVLGKLLRGLPRLIVFEALSSKLVLSRDSSHQSNGQERNPGSRRLSMTVKLDGWERVQIPGGKDLHGLVGAMSIYGSDAALTELPECCGSLVYLPEGDEDDGDTYQIELVVPHAQFEDLLVLCREGRLPRLTLGVLGVEYGNAPDGSQKVWATAGEAGSFLEVRSVQLVVPLTVETVQEDVAATPKEQTLTRLEGQLRNVFWVLVVGFIVLIVKS